MIDYNAIKARMVVEARTAVGPLLSLTGPAGNQRASVIQSRQGALKPDYPYIVVDILEVTKEGVVDGTYLNDTGGLQHDLTKMISLQYTVYGTDSNTGTTAFGIADQLASHFVVDTVMDSLREDIAVGVANVFDVTSVPVQIAGDEYLEVAFFTMSLSIADAIIISDADFIDRIVIPGQVFEDDDLSPTDTVIDVP